MGARRAKMQDTKNAFLRRSLRYSPRTEENEKKQDRFQYRLVKNSESYDRSIIKDKWQD